MLKTAELLMLMELVDGATLEQHRPTSAPKAIEVFKQAAEGLQALHETGFVHCDIKPNNIIVDDAGHVKIIDLGQSCPINTIKTRIQGTPDYIAPEQVLRQTITARTDVFNLGATMYWCLTNRHVPTMIPRTAGEQIGRLERAEFQPPIDIKPGIPKALNALVVSCLETEPASRPTSMREVHDRLNIVLRQLSRGANDQPHRLAR
jgi:serine/threonine-protein kinase